MDTTTGKRTAKVKLTLTKRTVQNLQPADKPWIAWDDRVSGFGVRVQPSGMKAFIVNYRTGSGGRKARNRRVGIGRCDHLAPEEARRLAQELLGRVARGEDPAQERAESRGMPTLREAFEEYLTANPNRKSSTEALYQSQMGYCLGDWLARPLDTITRRDVEARFHLVSQRNGWAVANHIISLLRSVYRRPCVDHQALRNPVELWLAGGGRYHRAVRRRISTPAEVLPRWWAAIEAEVIVPATRDIFWFGMYTGMRRGEIMELCWDRVDLERRICGWRRRRPASRWSYRSPGSWPPSSSAAARRPAPATAMPTGGCSPRPAGRATRWSCNISTAGSVGRRAPSSGSTGSGTCSSRWRSGS